MCRKATPVSERVKCGKCGEVANPTDGWEHGWPLYGTIDIGFPSQAFGALCGAKGGADNEHFAVWHEGHPAMTRNDAQHVTFGWTSDSPWRLCYNCQRKLLMVVGEFFGFPERAEQLKAKG